MKTKKQKKFRKSKKPTTGIVFDSTWVDVLLGYMAARKRVANA